MTVVVRLADGYDDSFIEHYLLPLVYPPELAQTTQWVLGGIVVFLSTYLSPSLLLLDTLTVGGDTPAHSYLASHLDG